MTERTIAANGLELWTEHFGDPADPAVLLIMGAESQGTMWPLPLIERIVAAGRSVIRYDNRDVGQSSVIDFENTPYDLNDLTADACAVLDAYGIEQAHIVGASMGGMILQCLMIDHPHRLLSATVVMSSPLSGQPDAWGRGRFFSEDLPAGPFMSAMDEIPPSAPAASREEYLEQRVAMFASLADPSAVDMDLLRQAFEAEYDRARDINAKGNHLLALGRSQPTDRRPLLSECSVRTAVIHGVNDPIFPVAHGRAIADAVPGAEFLEMADMAHDLPPHTWDAVVKSVSAGAV